MKRVSSYLKMRVLGAIEAAPGETIVARSRNARPRGAEMATAPDLG